MKLAYALTALFLTPVFAVSALASDAPEPVAERPVDDAEMKAASVPVENYIKALQLSSIDHARLAFHKDARMIGHGRDGFVSMPIEEWMKGLRGTPNADEAQRKRSFRILDLTPTTGIARVELIYPGVTFIDYMPLLKVDGEWKIMNKFFHAIRPPAAAN
ncbi:nuclear transport factor 2 family protein [Sphingomonas koreensis]|uniref:nuclear transport factor 2 family protein n=1 Tax=Sphingomonas koreensis TaxID=93064 RepID=UPI0008299167|nr:nuclear transport factor 2 family protein [Sphingomonas koreensis]PJI90858.1 putative lumazine-binding protein [Sphingomonas koreensis]RSU60171.1 nuclear transport factor 2 family protein [Sphingomonas koreensis]RSU68109.1 nuclear transport factor 2 family protein [Sphingomonas koreensis]